MKLSLLQKYFLERNKKGLYSCFIVGAKVDKSVPLNELEDALSKLVQNRVALRLSFSGDSIQETHPAISEVLETISASDITIALNEIHEVVFDLTNRKPSWKIILNHEWVFFACNHVFSDGNSAAMVIEDLIMLLNGGSIAEDVDVTEAYSKLITPSWTCLIKTICKELSTVIGANVFFSSFKESRSNVKEPSVISFKGQRHIFQITSEEFKKLKLVTSKEMLTFTELLMTLNYVALEASCSDMVIHLSIPVDQRRSLGEMRAYGAYISGIDIEIPRGIPSWDKLKEIVTLSPSMIRESAEIAGMLRYIDISKFIEQKVQSGRKSNYLEISNLGRRQSISGTYEAKEYIFSQPYHVVSDYFNVSVISSDSMTNIVVVSSPEETNFTSYRSNFEKLIRLVIGLEDNQGLSMNDLRSCVKR
jgi:hypothetical protein